MSSSSASVREPHVQSQRSQSYSARPQHRRLIAGIQVLFFVFGLIFLLIGGLRVALEFFGNIKDTVGSLSIDNIASIPTLIVGALMALLGYGLLWSVAALGAKEPPAWHSARNGLAGIVAMLVILMGITAWLNVAWLIFMVPIAVLFGGLATFLLLSFNQPSVRLALGADRLQKREAAGFNWVRNGFIVLVLSTMAVLGGVYAVLTDIIELPLPETEPGEFIFVTTFDNYNDEWDLYLGRNSSEILPDEAGNPRLVVKVDSGQLQDGVFSLLDRKVRDFDLRVTTNQLTSADDFDNLYGVIFRYRDNDNYYAFEISGDGYYRLVKVEDGVQKEISTWIGTTDTSGEGFEGYPTLIRPGRYNVIDDPLDTMNEIRVVGHADKFWFYVNGQRLKLCQAGESRESTYTNGQCYSDELTDYYQDDSFKQGKIGLLAGYSPSGDLNFPVTIAFDNLSMVGPDPDTIRVSEEPNVSENPN